MFRRAARRHRLALRPRRAGCARGCRASQCASDRTGHPQRGAGPHCRGRRGPMLPRPQARRARDRGRRTTRISRLHVVFDRDLQSDVRRRSTGKLLPGPARPGVHRALRDLPSALQHQHHPVLGASPAVPSARTQRRDQHHPGQCQSDASEGRAAGGGSACRRRPPQAGHR